MNSFLILMAWRNLWRSKRRTSLTLAAITLGIACLVCFTSLTRGFNQRIINLGTQTMKGEGQIHKRDYVTTHEASLVMLNASRLLEQLSEIPGISHITPRVFNSALAAMGDRAVSVEIMGIDPATEPEISNWKDRLWKGTYLNHSGEVMLGRKLAEKLELDVGGKLVLTVADIETGELNSQLFVVSTIIWSQNPQLNQRMAIINLQDAWALSGIQDFAHEFALRFEYPILETNDIHAFLDKKIPAGLELHNWQELMPEIAFLLKFQGFFMGITFVIIIFLVALGMMNTMGMAILERIREFGVLQALGTLPNALVKMVLYEFIWMGITGAALGLFIGWAITAWLALVGIPLNQVEVTGFLLTDPLFPIMDWPTSIIHAVVFCLCIPIFSIIPVRRVTRLDTVRALRFS